MSNEYTIENLADFLKVPDDRIEDCLKDFAIWIGTKRRFEAESVPLLEKLGIKKGVMFLDKFVWKDDGIAGVSDVGIEVMGL